MAVAQWLWRGRAVKLVDGTGSSMPDTQENQAVYPQPSTQASGVGFPQARLVMVICLATGGALDMAVGPHSGKGTGELALVRPLLRSFCPGDVMLADALYCNYFLIATLMGAGVDVLFEQNGSRITDFRRGQSLGARDHIVRWRKPAARPEWMTPEQYAGYPDELTVREARVDHQVLVTTKDCGRLFTLIAQCWVGNRPGRVEPRMRKLRPKSHPWLAIPRAQARRKIERHGHAWETK